MTCLLFFFIPPHSRTGETFFGDRAALCISEHGLQHSGLESVVVSLSEVESSEGGIVLDCIMPAQVDEGKGAVSAWYGFDDGGEDVS